MKPVLPSSRKRERTGCIGCRLRHKKCSGEAPECSNCLKNCILCTWQEPGNQKHSELLRRTNPTRERRRKAETPQRNRRTAACEPLLSSLIQFQDDSSAKLITDCLDFIPRALDSQILSSKIRSSSSRRLFHYYIHRANKVMAICQGTSNPFVSVLVPMALSNDSILNSLLACSGVHYADLTGAVADQTTWLHYGQAIQAQKFGLTLLAQGQNDVLVPLLFTAVLLCIVETFRAKSGALALYHLKAASALIQRALQLPENEIPDQTRAFLLERYMYTITLGHVTMGPESDEWVLNDTATLFPMISSKPGAGGIHELLRLIPIVSVTTRQLAMEQQLGLVSEQALSEHKRLVSLLTSWESSSDNEVYKICGRLYQQALLVYLISASAAEVKDSLGYSDPIRQTFDTFISLLESIPLESSISTTLCWPLAIFGSCARTEGHRGFIQGRLDLLSRVYSAQSVRDTKILLEKLWKENPRMASPLNFEYIMKKEGTPVLFF